jgi:hypothetical protein
MNTPQSESKKYTALELAHYFNDQSSSDIDMTDADLNRLAQLFQHIYDEGARHQATYIWVDCGQYDYENWKVPTTFYVTWPLPAIAETLPGGDKNE